MTIRKRKRNLIRVIESAPGSGDAVQAREMLGYCQARTGRYHEVVRDPDAILKVRDRSDVVKVRAIYAAFSRHPDLAIEKRRRRRCMLKSARLESCSRYPFMARRFTGYLIRTSMCLPCLNLKRGR